MALEKDVNSFVSLAEAEAYFENRLDVDAWTSATEPQKSQALVTATSMLNDMSWKGYISDENQKLAFPRVGLYFDKKYGKDVPLDSPTCLARVRAASCELAYHLLNNDGLLDDAGLVENLKIGSIQLTNIGAPSKTPTAVRAKIAPMLDRVGSSTSSSGRAWWRAN